MSFVEGISTVSIAEPALVLCVSGVVLVLVMLAAVPALATTLHFLHFDSLGKVLRRWLAALSRGPRQP
jgi:hypothetical protein